VDGDRQGWVQGVRLMLVAVVCAVLTATLVIQGGSLILDNDRDEAGSRRISPASW
jgi:hypothetical protein